jgi:hypothetical protein
VLRTRPTHGVGERAAARPGENSPRRVVRISAFSAKNAPTRRPRTCGLPKGRTRFGACAVFGVSRHNSFPFEHPALISLIENQNNQRWRRSARGFRPLRLAALARCAPPPSMRLRMGEESFANAPTLSSPASRSGAAGGADPALDAGEAEGALRASSHRAGRRNGSPKSTCQPVGGNKNAPDAICSRGARIHLSKVSTQFSKTGQGDWPTNPTRTCAPFARAHSKPIASTGSSQFR